MKYSSLLILILILCLIFTFNFNSVFANNDIQIFTNPDNNQKAYTKVNYDNDNYREIESWDDTIKSTLTLNKKSNVISVITICLDTNKIINSYTINNKPKIDNSIFTMASINKGKDFLGGKFSYTVNTQNKNWTIKIPNESGEGTKTKNIKETSNNRDDLKEFRNSIDKLYLSQITLLAELGGGNLGIMGTLIVTPEPWTTIVGLLGLLGFGIASIPLFYNVWKHSKDAKYYFNRI